ncbi:MAG: tRNA pseudouridine(55) synthase [Evtepia sp.]|jgi:tRNA pseudouridine55 synthase|nr:tRNA pseudouridine(55) synthase [Evtepia sp.]
MPSGIIVIDKPADWTSHDVVAKLRGYFKERRIGHSGTLDPMATGVLPVFVGRATRAVEFAAEGKKEYIAGLRLGLVTDTQDITGKTIQRSPVDLSWFHLESTLSAFRGDILQIPPMYSAIKKHGKKLYEIARSGKEVEREPRPITIYELELLDQLSPTDFFLRIVCSKGTYIRTLCHDLGAMLGPGGCLFSLRRTKAAGFTQEESVTMEQILASSNPFQFLLPIDSYFSNYPCLTVDTLAEQKIRNGMQISFPSPNGTYRVYGENQAFLILGRVEENVMTTIKSFFEV